MEDNLTPLLLDAKEEYLGQVTDVMAPHVLTTFAEMHADAASRHKGRVLLSFQHRLREIPGWNANVVRQKTQDIEVRYKSLGKLIAALFVSVVKIMSTIRLNRDRPNIRLRLPSNDAFVHQVYIQTAREFYTNPHLIHESRGARIKTVREGVRAAVREMLPIDDILTAYLGGSVDGDGTMSPLPDDDWATAAGLAPGLGAAAGLAAAVPATLPTPTPAPDDDAGSTSDDDGSGNDSGNDSDSSSTSSRSARSDRVREINLNRRGDEGGGSVVVPSTQPDPDEQKRRDDRDDTDRRDDRHGSDRRDKRKKDLFSDAEDDF
jgi:hypothetical protein